MSQPQPTLIPVTVLAQPARRWRPRSLTQKLLLPIVGLMLVSLLTSTLAFVGGTAFTQNQLLQQQMAVEVEWVTGGLASRADLVASVTAVLARDPQISTALYLDSQAGLSLLNSRAVVVRDRFGVDLIQIFDATGRSRTNLVLSALYRESSLLDVVRPGPPAVYLVDGRLLLLSRAELPGGEGTIIAGIDLETELGRLAAGYRLLSELALSAAGATASINSQVHFDVPEGRSADRYATRMPLTLGATPAELLLVRSTTDVTHVTTTGLWIMVASTLFTTALLTGVAVLVARSIAQPVEHLSAAAQAVAAGDLDQEVAVDDAPRTLRFGIGVGDEIGLLALSFNRMVAQLRGLYQNLETKVDELAAANERLLELDQLKSQFVSDVSHELRTPLTSIKGYGDLIFRGRAGPVTEMQHHFLEIILSNTNRLTDLINNVLDIARIDSGRGASAATAVNVNTLVAQVVDAQSTQAESAGLALAFDNGCSLPAVHGDPGQLVQVITNLVSNALNYTPAGEVRIHTFFEEQSKQVCIEVRDTGVGIAPGDLPHIFDRFYRSDAARDSAVRGTGLGLAIVQEIVKAHGGRVAAESVVGQGSNFQVWLPALYQADDHDVLEESNEKLQ